MKAQWIPRIVVATALLTGPASADTIVQAPPGGLNVHVNNTADEPVPVTIQGQLPAPEPYQQSVTDVSQSTEFLTVDFPDVPSGFRLVIQDVAGNIGITGESGEDLPAAVTCTLQGPSQSGGTVFRALPTGRPIPRSDTSQAQTFSESVVMYVDAGKHASILCSLSDAADLASLSTYLAGFLIPVGD